MYIPYTLFLLISLFVDSYCRLLSLCLIKYPSIPDNLQCLDGSPTELYEYNLHHVIKKREVSALDGDRSNSTIDNMTLPREETSTVPLNDIGASNVTEVYEDTTFDPEIAAAEHNLTLKLGQHRYYQSRSTSGMENVNKYWVDLNILSKDDVVSHNLLSNAHRRALTVALTFDFPFYGHMLRNVTVATGGFLFTGAFLHKWLAATQYIAPLMANFDTSVSTDASVKFVDNGTSLTVQWEKVVLKDSPYNGSFTFQVTLHSTGLIVFAYKDVPVSVPYINDEKHPVKVGLSDAYIVEKTVFFVRKKTIYEYHKISMKEDIQIGNWTAVIFEPLPNCVAFNSCNQCLTESTTFKCEWCQRVGRCSDGMDRHRQMWIENGCMDTSVSNASVCAFLPPPPTTPKPYYRSDLRQSSQKSLDRMYGQGLLIGLLMFFTVVVFLVGWFVYAYFNPLSPSGQFIIKYRPSAWSWRRGQARYTAATMQSIYM